MMMINRTIEESHTRERGLGCKCLLSYDRSIDIVLLPGLP